MNLFSRALLGSGRLPDSVRTTMQAEGIEYLAEGLTGSVRYHAYRAPGVRRFGAVDATAGAVVVTRRRLLVWLTRGEQKGKHLDVPLRDGQPFGVTVRVEGGRLILGYEPAAFHADRSGRVELRLKTPEAARIAVLLGAG
ncbi:hypothetical protein VSH64_25180 [Amycolatopsis rhabdoformis]|uniref:Uncharacterized protein n=1 Tax=Amycolatopsis rhabdoformis TaxID=1448059 RepID=A0ABZ1HXS6_9PSEU|nr:hypothetical protein [Amycolatopsis rhabdoformis]WSE26170.1 hypothetical protein VSH64_25180 [Amycolatopsis rhabdoformis]